MDRDSVARELYLSMLREAWLEGGGDLQRLFRAGHEPVRGEDIRADGIVLKDRSAL